MENAPLIHLIADYGLGDPAFGEVSQRLHAYLPGAQIIPTAVPAFDTLATGFWIYQYGLAEVRPKNMVIYSNTAPRKDNKEKRADNEGEGMLYAKLDNGVSVLAVNAGYTYSFIKDHLVDMRLVKVANKGSQFRSRDFYPKAVAAFIKGEDILGKPVKPDTIPQIPEHRILWIDGYGNIKTTIRASEKLVEPGQKIKVKINGIVRTAMAAGGNFSVAEGELSFSPGSSGHHDPFMELFLRGGSAEHLFEFPRAGAKINLRP